MPGVHSEALGVPGCHAPLMLLDTDINATHTSIHAFVELPEMSPSSPVFQSVQSGLTLIVEFLAKRH